MTDIFSQAQQAALHGEAKSREADIETFKALMNKPMWTEAEMDQVTNLWCRAEQDGQLNACMEALQREWLHSQGLDVTPDDVARAQRIVNRVFREYYEEP